MNFLFEYKWVILFYLIIAIFIYVKRNKFEIQAKIIFLYRTNFGLKFIDKVSSKYGEFIKLLSLIGVGAGFIGLVAISFILIQNLFVLLFKPGAAPGVSLIIPGVHIPGSPIFVPFWFGIIALFIVVVVHEFGHGVVARAHKLKVKSSGFGLFAILPIAFVEPDEKDIVKQKDYVQHSIFAAGPFFNILLALLAMGLVSFIFFPIQEKITEPIGFTINEVQEGFPAEQSGMEGGSLIIAVNDIPTPDVQTFIDEMELVRPGENIKITTNKTDYNILTAENPDDSRKAYLGVIGFTNEVQLKNQSPISKFLFSIFLWFKQLFSWIVVLSFGIGLANLLPLGPVDGGRMLHVALGKLYKKKEKGITMWRNISLIFLFILLINIFYPIIRQVFGSIL